ncbi:MAG: transposase [Ignavibacteriales bacterium]|nr:transposase [Ignavibacteriales bacterium]
MVLIFGTILAPGRRTVTAALRMMGLGTDRHFSKYHRVLSRDRWSPWVVSKVLLSLIILIFLPSGAPLLLVIDETLERRRGKQIKYKGWFRDPILSTREHVVKALGIRWVCLAVLVPIPWSQRLWALPFMTVLALGVKTSMKLNKQHRTIVQWAEFMIDKVRRWQPQREITLVGDGSYAAVALVQLCQRLKKPINLVSRLRLDARLFDFPAPQPKSKRGPKPKKGAHQTQLSQRLEDPQTHWNKLKILLYGKEHFIEFISDISFGIHPVKIQSRSAGCWYAAQKTVSNPPLSSAPMQTFLPGKSLSGSLGVGISKSPSKNCVLASVSKPNVSGLTAPSNAPRLASSVSSAW